MHRLVLVLAVPLLLAGCAQKIKTGQMESKIAEDYARGIGVKPKVDCPDGRKAEKGNTFECAATIGSEKVKLLVTVVDDGGRFTYVTKQDGS